MFLLDFTMPKRIANDLLQAVKANKKFVKKN